MNRAEHHVEADQAAARIEQQMKRMDPDPDVLTEWSVRLQLAQVHATLASGVLAEGEPAPRRDGTYDQTARTLIETNDLRASLENAEQSRRLAEGLLKTERDRIRHALAIVGGFDTSAANGPMGRLLEILAGDQKYAAGGLHKTLCTDPAGHRPEATECPLPSDGPGQ